MGYYYKTSLESTTTYIHQSVCSIVSSAAAILYLLGAYELSYLPTRSQVGMKQHTKGRKHVRYSNSTSMYVCVYTQSCARLVLRVPGIVLSCYIYWVWLWYDTSFFSTGAWVGKCVPLNFQHQARSLVIVFAPEHPQQQYLVGTTAAKSNRSTPQRPRPFLDHVCRPAPMGSRCVCVCIYTVAEQPYSRTVWARRQEAANMARCCM